jgi:hypothetical protein
MPVISATSYLVAPVVNKDDAEELLNSLEELWGTQIERRYNDHEPPAAGMSEIATILEVIVNSKEVLLMLFIAAANAKGPAGKVADALRNHLRTANKSEESQRRYIPFSLEVGTNPQYGSVRFYFHGDISDDRFEKQMSEARRLVEALPDELLSAMSGPQEYGFFWDRDADTWRGRLYSQETPDSYEEMWWPDDLRLGWSEDDSPDEEAKGD